jgi:hypothetical protein
VLEGCDPFVEAKLDFFLETRLLQTPDMDFTGYVYRCRLRSNKINIFVQKIAIYEIVYGQDSSNMTIFFC